ncbi:hypothetical protein DSN97_08335 [Deferribacteraceae bacterium V6Fe1]|nr:hypothetical protein DSN97_08335 [Deferribacteraceae bacterium V6Fe1]
MKKLGVVLIIIFAVFGCTSKKISPVYLEGESLFEKYIDNYLKGKQVSEVYFNKAVNVFQRADDFCNLSRLYLSRFVLNEENIDTKSLESAEFFADTGKCRDEKNIINYLTDKEYILEKLPEHYRKYIKHKKSKKYDGLEDILSAAPEYFTSRILRKTARESEGRKALILVDEAYQIDRFNGWTLNIYRDLKIKREIMLKMGSDISDIDVRLRNLGNILKIKK